MRKDDSGSILAGVLFNVVVLLVILLLSFFASMHATKTDGEKVTATIFPIYDMTKNVAGDLVKVELLLPPGASPHTFEPSPADLEKVADSKILFMIGHGIDTWAESLAESAHISDISILDRNIVLHASEHEHQHEDEEHDEEEIAYDPHYWLSIPNAIKMVDQIAEELSVIYPEYSDEFRANALAYQLRLDSLDAELQTKLSGIPDRDIATFHNAWGYFADSMGLNIVATFEEFPGEVPTANYLAEFQSQLSSTNVSVIFTEPQFSSKSIESIAADLEVSLSVLDPVGGVGDKQTYEDLIRYNVDQVYRSLTDE